MPYSCLSVEPLDLRTQQEAAEFIESTIKPEWLKLTLGDEQSVVLSLGDVSIEDEQQWNGRTVWQYTIAGLPVSRDGRKRWLLSTGEFFDTTITDDTFEKAYERKYGNHSF